MSVSGEMWCCSVAIHIQLQMYKTRQQSKVSTSLYIVFHVSDEALKTVGPFDLLFLLEVKGHNLEQNV